MHHSIDIALEIAQRMKSLPEVASWVLERNPSTSFKNETSSESSWANATFSEGFPGIACFYAEMDHQFPNQGFDEIAHAYIKESAERFQSFGSPNNSLFTGITGLCFAVNLCSKENNRYQTLLNKLEIFLIDQIELAFLNEINTPLSISSPRFYSLAEGLSGIISYGLMRSNNHRLQFTIGRCIEKLIQLFSNPLQVNGKTVPAWYVSPEDQLAEDEKEKYPEGSFLLGTAFGITGVLSSLSLAGLAAIQVERLRETIETIAYWLKEQKRSYAFGSYWPHTLSADGQKSLNPDQLNRDLWWSGIPAVCRSLYLAGKYLHNKELLLFSEQVFQEVFSKPAAEWNAMGTSLLHGRAGMLALTYQMARDTKNPFLQKQVTLLEEDLKTFYRPHSRYGFQMVDVSSQGVYSWVDAPGMALGTAGTALTLLRLHRENGLNWERAFLMN